MRKNMSHSWIKKNIIRFIDNDLNENEKKEFHAHISVCKECRKEYEYIHTIVKNDQEKYSAPDSLYAKILSSLDAGNNSPADFVYSYSLSKKYSLVFLLAIFVILGTFIGNSLLPDKSMSDSDVDLTEEYIPGNNNVFTSNFTGNGR